MVQANNTFEEIALANNDAQLIGSSNSNTTTARRVTVEAKAVQCLSILLTLLYNNSWMVTATVKFVHQLEDQFKMSISNRIPFCSEYRILVVDRITTSCVGFSQSKRSTVLAGSFGRIFSSCRNYLVALCRAHQSTLYPKTIGCSTTSWKLSSHYCCENILTCARRRKLTWCGLISHRLFAPFG